MSTIRVSLCSVQRRAMKKQMDTTSNKYESLRCRILLFLDEGNTVAEVTQLAQCARATVYRTVYRFEDWGEAGLRDGRKCRACPKVSNDVIDKLLDYLDAVPKDFGWQRSSWTQELLALQLVEDLGVSLTPQHVGRVLKQSGCRRGRPRPALRIPIKGRRETLDKIERLVEKASPDEEVLYLDEADVDLNPRIGLTYIKRGGQPLILTPGKNVKYYIGGALNARTGKVLYAHGPRKNSDLFIDSLHVISKAYRRAQKIHIVLDNYIIHKSAKTKQALQAFNGRIQLHFLPPYSPENNPIERLWKQMHDHVTRNHRHKDMLSLWQDVVRFLEDVQPFPGTKVSTLRMTA